MFEIFLLWFALYNPMDCLFQKAQNDKTAVIVSKQALDSFASATIHKFIRTLQAV